MPKLTADDKAKISEIFEQAVRCLADQVGSEQTQRGIEEVAAKTILPAVAATLGVLFERRCAEETLAALAANDIDPGSVAMRKENGYTAKMTSIFGPVRFSMCAFRSPSLCLGPIGSTVVPAQATFLALYGDCRSTQLCLEWETRLGADHPFRIAQDELNYVTHGAVTVEDNTIGRHLVSASRIIGRRWLYKDPEDIAQILKTRAMHDLKTGRPVLYLSSDAHALRRYVDDTWAKEWKMTNGVRIWAVDRNTGETIHIGGEFTWGKCEDVVEIFKDLIALNILPERGLYNDDVRAQFVWISDGAPWLRERIAPLFNGDLVEILDVYHLLEYASAFADIVIPKDEKTAWFSSFKSALFISASAAECSVKEKSSSSDANLAEDSKTNKAKTRKGHRKASSAGHKMRELHLIAARARPLDAEGTTAERIASAFPAFECLDSESKENANHVFLRYLGNNEDRIEYAEMQSRGLQIGSGAMESMHRNGSQVRLKRSGATFLQETSQAIMNWRMLRLSGRWGDFWGQQNLCKQLACSWPSVTHVALSKKAA